MEIADSLRLRREQLIQQFGNGQGTWSRGCTSVIPICDHVHSRAVEIVGRLLSPDPGDAVGIELQVGTDDGNLLGQRLNHEQAVERVFVMELQPD
jgi:hypothetical protein